MINSRLKLNIDISDLNPSKVEEEVINCIDDKGEVLIIIKEDSFET